jgi:hypothetical protein
VVLLNASGRALMFGKKFMLIREEIRALPQRFKTKKLAITLPIK